MSIYKGTQLLSGINSVLLNAKADLDLDNLNSTGKGKLGPTVYTASGMILNSEADTCVGYGIATVYLFKNGIAEVHFNIQITTAGTGSSYFKFGLNREKLRDINPNIPVITPQNGGSLIFYDSSGAVSNDLMGYGGTLSIAGTNTQFWEPARVYDTNGSIGGWSASQLTVGRRMIGVCYGTYTV